VRLTDSRSEARFRAELGEWLDENQPAADRAADPARSSGHVPGWAADWQGALFAAGWLVPRWPSELGGRDASAVEQMIYLEELSRRRLPRTTNPHGLDVCAPTIVDHGTPAQRDRWLPATLRGRVTWCVAVGPTEHADGASLELRDGGAGPAVSGTVPSAGAAHADRCLCAARSGAGPEPGVSVLAVDLTAPGVARPEADGGDLVLAEVPVVEGDAIGPPGEGWAVVQSIRARLRSVSWITGLLAAERAVEALVEVGRARGLGDDAVFRDRVAGLQVDVDSARALAYRAVSRQGTGRPNPELAMMPLVTRALEQRLYLAGLESLGADGLDLGIDGPRPWPSGSWADEWVTATTETATAGGLGAERDRVAGRVLGLPLA
jgi:alkylation response protein AidB-like acyl-CoA dehydrogenase